MNDVPVWCPQLSSNPLADNRIGSITENMHARLGAPCYDYWAEDNHGNDAPILHNWDWIVLARFSFSLKVSKPHRNFSVYRRINFHYPYCITLRISELRLVPHTRFSYFGTTIFPQAMVYWKDRIIIKSLNYWHIPSFRLIIQGFSVEY